MVTWRLSASGCLQWQRNADMTALGQMLLQVQLMKEAMAGLQGRLSQGCRNRNARSRVYLRDAGPDDGAGVRDGAVGDQDLAAAGGVDEHAERAAVQLVVAFPADAAIMDVISKAQAQQAADGHARSAMKHSEAVASQQPASVYSAAAFMRTRCS